MPNIVPNPVTSRIIGTRTFDVGPGWPHSDADTVPWAALTAGDVVNFHYRTSPYQKFGIRAKGTNSQRVIINGVTDANGNRPIISGQTRTAAGTKPGNTTDIFSDNPSYGESLGVIVIKRGSNDAYFTYKPSFIEIKNLEIRDAADNTTYTTLAGSVAEYASAAAIYLLPSADVTIENCVLTNCSFGLFTMAKDGLLSQACERVTLRHCRVFGNGSTGSYLEHNVYMQSTNPIVEGNYIGKLRAGALGSSYKSRSSGEIFRYNYVDATLRAVDFVHSEEQSIDGILTRPDYGIDYCYGNVIVNDGTAANPIHYGGDNLGEEDGSVSPSLPSNPNLYRKHLYFWHNTIFQNTSDWRTTLVQLSLTSIICDAWNNIVRFSGTGAVRSLIANAGVLNLRGNNLISGSTNDYLDSAQPNRAKVNRLGTVVTAEPQFVNPEIGNVSLNASSPAINQSGPLPPGIPSTIGTNYPLQNQPRIATNGLLTRTQQGSSFDLGALEFGIGDGGALNEPFNTSLPTLSGGNAVGSLVTVNVGTWTGSPLIFSYRWNRNGSAISGATESTYVLQSADVGATVNCTVTATNSAGSTSASSAGIVVSGGTSGALGPDSQGVFTWDHPNGTSLQAVNSKWQDAAGSLNDDLECQANRLRAKSGRVSNGRVYLYKNAQGADQSSKARIPVGGLANGGNLYLYINHQDSAIGYYLGVFPTAVQLRRQGVFIHNFNHGINFANTAATIELRKVGAVITIRIDGSIAYTYTDSAPITGGWPGLSIGSTTGSSSDSQIDAWTDNPLAAVTGVPLNVVPPALSGTPTSGLSVSCSSGSWLYSPANYAYQWNRNGISISGATSSSYTLQSSDVGTSVACVVTASNTNGSASVTSNSLLVSAGGSAPTNVSLPVISGSATVGSTLSATTGTWTNSPSSFTYQWRRNGVSISAASASSYQLQAADAGTVVTCSITASNASGSTTVTSAGVSISGGSSGALGPDSQGVFTWDYPNGTSLEATNAKWEDIAGTSSFDLECQSNRLRCKPGSLVNARTYAYKNGQGANQASRIRIAAGGLVNGGQIYLYINHQNSIQGYYLAIFPTLVQLRRQGVFVHQFNHGINLATTAAIFELIKTGSNVLIKVNGTLIYTYTDSAPINGGWPCLNLSSSTAAVTDAQLDAWTDSATASLSGAPSNSVVPVLSGLATVGSTLSCTTGTWANQPTAFAYQWRRNGTNIAGATGSSYVLQSADAGTGVSCRVTASNASGSASATSASVTVSASGVAPSNTALPLVTGTAVFGSTLVCSTGTWNGSPTSYAYQWRRGASDIPGANGSTYQLTTADVGTNVSCRVTAGNSFGSGSATSIGVSVTGGSGDALGPDVNGVFTWNHSNGTSLQTVNPKWEDVQGSSSFDLECQSNQLRCKVGMAVNGRTYIFKNGQGANQASRVRIAAGGLTGSGRIDLYINHQSSAEGYFIAILPTAIQLRRGSVFVHMFDHGINLNANAAVFGLVKSGSTISIRVNATTPYSYTDPSPINTGWPGLNLGAANGTVTQARLDSWTDNATAAL